MILKGNPSGTASGSRRCDASIVINVNDCDMIIADRLGVRHTYTIDTTAGADALASPDVM